MNASNPVSLGSPFLQEGEEEWVRALLEKVRSLRFGTVQLKIHEARVVVIETTEQTRFDLSPKPRR